MGRYGWKRTVESLYSISVDAFKRWGNLAPGTIAGVSWSRGGNQTGSIVTIAEQDRLILKYTITTSGEGKQDVSEPVLLDWTKCNFGGRRPWFVCPNCSQRVGKLYLSREHFYCRRCWRLGYQSQTENAGHRALLRAQRIRMRLGGSANICELFPWKPKGMHWKTYERLRQTANACENAYLRALDSWLFTQRW